MQTIEKGLVKHRRARRDHVQPTARSRNIADRENSPVNPSRWFDATTGRWLSEDPVGLGPDSNPYRYCGNGPISYVDPSGLRAGDEYPSENAAATAWGREFNGPSITSGTEYMSIIYENANGTFSYTPPAIGGAHGMNHVKVPEAMGPVRARIHSHGKYEKNWKNNCFSKHDLKIYNENLIDGYVTTPNGSLQKFTFAERVDPTTNMPQGISTISTDMPSDKNDPDRLNNVDPPRPPDPWPSFQAQQKWGL